jgi:Rad3-related DNA helicase
MVYEKLKEYNQERFLVLMNAGWDLIVVDEAHKLEAPIRSRKTQARAESRAGAPYILLLSRRSSGKERCLSQAYVASRSIAFTWRKSSTETLYLTMSENREAKGDRHRGEAALQEENDESGAGRFRREVLKTAEAV